MSNTTQDEKESVYKMFRTCKRGREACEGETHVRVHGPDPPVQFGPLTVRSRPRPARKLSHPGAYSGSRRLLGMCMCHLPVSRLGARLHRLCTVPHSRCMRSARWVEPVACSFAVNLHWTRIRKRRVSFASNTPELIPTLGSSRPAWYLE
jgi:hypothetical protein